MIFANRRNGLGFPFGFAESLKRLVARPALKTLVLLVALAVALPAPLVSVAFADPPPWAPAHGYRYKNKYKGKHYLKGSAANLIPNIGIGSGTCYRQVIGGILGGIAGGVAGSQVGKGTGKTAATIGGALLGVLIGGSIGRSMDQVDQNCVSQTLERAEDHRTVVWKNPDAGTDYRVTPVKTYQDDDGRYCREYITEATIGGKTEQLYGHACRLDDGSWQLS